MKRSTPLLGLVLLLVLSSHTASALQDPPAPPAPPVAAAPGDDLDAVTTAMSAEVERIRGIRFLTPVGRRTKDRAEVVEEFQGKGKKAEAGTIDAGTRTLCFFGLREEKDLLKVNAAASDAGFRAASVGGYYSSRDKVFTLVNGDGGTLNRMIVFHELVHAVEDQHYDFEAHRSPLHRDDLSDHLRAFRALVEGSAQWHTDRWLDAEPGRRSAVMEEILAKSAAKKGPPKEGAKKPPDRPRNVSLDPGTEPAHLFLENMMFPYHNGALFLAQVLPALPPPAEGEDPLARIYASPPVSSEQILHPDKYLGKRDLPRAVRPPDLAAILGEGWSAQDTDTWGEFGVGMTMNAWLYPRATSVQVSAVLRPPPQGFRKPEDLLNTPILFRGTSGTCSEGWDGDRYTVYGKGPDSCLAWVLVFDADADAAEFVEGYAKVLKRKYPAAVRGEDGTWNGTRGGRTSVVASGDRVTVAEGIPEAAFAAVIEALSKTEVVQDPADAVPATR